MPFSTSIFKEQIEYFIKRIVKHSDIKILDIGAGSGTYADLLRPTSTNIDAIEVFTPYIEEYNLWSKYKNVFNHNVMNTSVDFSTYELIILGDVFEHLSEQDSKQLMDRIFKTDAEVIVAVPFNSPQDSMFNNEYERHLQPRITFQSILKTHKQLIPLCVRYDYGVFIKNNSLNEYLPLYVKDLDVSYIEKLRLLFPHKALIDIDEEIKKYVVDDIFTEELNSQITIVTGLWDMGREGIPDNFKRPYTHYKEKFAELLKAPVNMVIYASKEDEEFIWTYRSPSNTMIKITELEEFKTWFDHFDKVQQIRKNESWYSQVGWLVDAPQTTLEYYNPVVMSKMFMLNNATIYNPFDTQYFFWIDAGITSTVHPGYFTHDKVLDKLSTYVTALQKFLFLSYPYIGGEEIHGFGRSDMAKYCNVDYVKYVCRGGFFGGEKSIINSLNGLYYNLLTDTLHKGLMGTEESIFTILAHRYPELIHRFELSDDGMVWPFFEKAKNIDELISEIPKEALSYKTAKNNLYVLTFNSPTQFKKLCDSIKHADPTMFNKSRKILINNSTNKELFGHYDRLCTEYNFEEIHLNNLGVCGGRQFAAEHFNDTDADFYMFFEDDMEINGEEYKSQICKCGFIQYVPNLYDTVIKIMTQEKLDFLKFSFSEFYGDNSVQWAWYNVPQEVRTHVWPHYDRLPELGLDPNAPRTHFDSIRIMDGIAYITGQVYYSNWPQIVGRNGNKKMFLDTKWEFPYEQTWMSHMFQETLTGNLTSAILLASPITHDRTEFYPAEERREN